MGAEALDLNLGVALAPESHIFIYRRLVLLLLLSGSLGSEAAGAKDGYIPISKFTISRPAAGTYGVWRYPKQQIDWYAGEVVVIKDTSFRYTWFSDVAGDNFQTSGSLRVFKDHILLDQPGVRNPYRAGGKADGKAILITKEGYEEWKKSRQAAQFDILWLEPEKRK